LTSNCLRSATAVIDACSLQFVDSRSIEPSPLHTAGNHQSVTRDLAAVRKLQDSIGAFRADFNSFLRRQNLHAEALRLNDGPPGQITTAQASGKAEIILNA